MLTTDTMNIGSGSTVVDLWAQLVNSSMSADSTPAHDVTVQNNGARTLRCGAVGAVSTNNGFKIGPGESHLFAVLNPNRIGVVGDAGASASSITVLIQVH